MCSTSSAMIDNTARLYHCARCHAQTLICRDCDRGHVYCKDCALPAGLEAKNRAATRYQESHRGKLNHAARQRRNRERQKQKVTHNGCVELEKVVRNVRTSNSSNKPSISANRVAIGSIFCHFCDDYCSEFLRLSFLRRPNRIDMAHATAD